MVKCAQRDINSDLALQSTDIPIQCRRGLESQTDRGRTGGDVTGVLHAWGKVRRQEGAGTEM